MKINSNQPPRSDHRFLIWFCPKALSEGIEGDMLEQFDDDIKIVGLKKAKRKFVWNTLKYYFIK